MQNQSQGSIMGMAMPLAIFIVIFYFLILRPQKKRQQEHDKLISSIKIGDTVITAGGFYGKVCEELEDSYIILLDENLKARILKSSISSKIVSEKSSGQRKKKKKKRPIAGENGQEALSVQEPQTEQTEQPAAVASDLESNNQTQSL